MSTVSYGPHLTTEGLILALDAANPRSATAIGTDWNDVSGNRITSALTATTYTTNNRGGLVFNGTAQAGSVTLPNPNGQLTVQCAMNFSNIGAYHNIFDRTGSSPMWWIRSGGAIELNTTAGLISASAYNNQNIVMAATFSTGTPGLQLFVNGQLVQQTTTAQASWPNPFTITLFNRANSSRFQGTMYSMLFYNRVLSVAEIGSNFQAIRGRFGL